MTHIPGRVELNRERAQPGLIPCIGWSRDYRKDWLRYDVMAGMITAAVIIPKAMAYATVAGLPRTHSPWINLRNLWMNEVAWCPPKGRCGRKCRLRT